MNSSDIDDDVTRMQENDVYITGDSVTEDSQTVQTSDERKSVSWNV